ncbi:MAG: glycogen debranching protein GlgX [Pirellulales bacterium]|nr:glycogen debranching protein GlgX [Planctomycetales bacterium]
MSMKQVHPPLHFKHQVTYGAVVRDGGVQFSVFSRSATAMRLLLYNKVSDREPTDVIHFDRDTDRWGDIWSVFVPGVHAGQLYHFQADGPFIPHHGQRFDGRARLIDPYAQALTGDFQTCEDGISRPPKCVVIEDTFDWQGDRHLKRELAESVIYEMHVRGFTRSRSSRVEHPGTYLGLIEKIPYLQNLGVTAVELMPVCEYPIKGADGHPPSHRNYWGYDPMCFFSPHRGYASGREPGAQVNEFKEMVRAFHAAGIEVILDVVFNHTSEGNEHGPTFCYKGLENRIYYMLEQGGAYYRNYSGCGNTINGNHPVVREMIFNCLRHWVLNYHVDGFRFDLASILSRDGSGNILPNPPIVELIAEDPLLADTKIIAEAWDAAGAYQVGSFANRRWAEWNGRYRDDVRRFWRGDPHHSGGMATRLSGSSDLYQHSGRNPYHSINFITSHDGFTINDLVSYSHKHNEANGENNADGENNNYSHNYGIEGPTRRRGVNRVRSRQIKNMLATLLLSAGVPMLVSGDECRRTQRGNNNAYCQDTDISWFDWRLTERYTDLIRFVRTLINFRLKQPTVRPTTFLTGHTTHPDRLPDVAWYDAFGQPINWDKEDGSLACILGRRSQRPEPSFQGLSDVPRDIAIVLHSGNQARDMVLPIPMHERQWRLFVDTAADSPKDVYPDLNGPAPPRIGKLTMEAHSLICYVSAE